MDHNISLRPIKRVGERKRERERERERERAFTKWVSLRFEG